MLTSITFERGPKSKIATSDFKSTVWRLRLPSFKAQLLTVFEQSEGMCEKKCFEILTKRLFFRKMVNLKNLENCLG